MNHLNLQIQKLVESQLQSTKVSSYGHVNGPKIPFSVVSPYYLKAATSSTVPSNSSMQSPKVQVSFIEKVDCYQMVKTEIDELLVRYGDEVTDHSIATISRILATAHDQMGDSFPRGYPCEDAGGIRIEWISPEKELRLIVSGYEQEQSYIYHETSDEYDTDEVVTGENLTVWLNWFIGNE